jgi:hypothetical protein
VELDLASAMGMEVTVVVGEAESGTVLACKDYDTERTVLKRIEDELDNQWQRMVVMKRFAVIEQGQVIDCYLLYQYRLVENSEVIPTLL